MAETKLIPLDLDLSSEAKSILSMLGSLDGKTIRPTIEIDRADLAKELASITSNLPIKIRLDASEFQKDLNALLGKKDLQVQVSADLASLKSELSQIEKKAASKPLGSSKNLSSASQDLSDVDKRRVNRSLNQFRESYSASDLIAIFRGTDARRSERIRVAEKIADRRNLNDAAKSEFLKRAGEEQLPAAFDIRRLGNRDVIKSLGHAGIQSGPLGAVLGAALAATPLRAAGAVLGGNLASTASEVIEGPRHLIEQIGDKFKEAALNMDRSLSAIAGNLQAATSATDAFGTKLNDISRLNISLGQAKLLQSAVRPALANLGVSGTAEGTVVQSLYSGFSQRGINLTPDQLKTVASRLVSTVVAKSPEFFENESVAGKDLLDIALSAPGAKRTQAGVALGSSNLSRISAATSGVELLRATEALAPFVTAAEGIDSPATLQRKLEANFGSLNLAGGEKLLAATNDGMKVLIETLGKPEAVQAAQALGSAIGTLSDVGLKATAGFTQLGVGVSNFIQANAELSAALIRSSGLLGQFLSPILEASKSEQTFTESQANIDRIRSAGVIQSQTSESIFDSTLNKIGLKEAADAYTVERRQAPDLRLAEIDNLIGNLSRGSDEDKQLLASRQSFLGAQRAKAVREQTGSIVAGFDRSTGGRLAASAYEIGGLRRESQAIGSKLAADEGSLTAAADQLRNRGGERGDLLRQLNRAEAELKVRRQVVQQGDGNYLQDQTAFAEAANRRNALKTQLENFDSGTSKIQLQLSQQGADFLSSRREAAALEQQILSATRNRLGLETERTIVLKQANEGRSLVGAKQNLPLEATGSAKAENAALTALQTSEKLIEKTTSEVTSLKGKISQEGNQELKAIEQQALIEAEARLRSLNFGADEDRARLASTQFRRLDAGLETRLIGSGIPELERERTGINKKNSIPGSIRDAQLQDLILGKKRSAIQSEIDLASRNIALLAKNPSARNQQEIAVLTQFKDRLSGEQTGLAGEQAGVRQVIGSKTIDYAQSLQGLKVSADALIEAERRSKAELDNLTISYKEQKNALADFKTGLQEAYAGQEEKLFGAAKSYVNAGGDLSKLPGFLQQAVTNPEQYEQSFALARLRGVLRESTGIDDPSLQGASLGIPTFGSRFSENLDNQQRRLENQLDISANDRDLFKTNLQNQRTDFGFKLGQAQQSGLFDSSNIFSSPVGGNNSQVDGFLKNFQQILAQLNQASGTTVGSSLPQGGPGGLGTTAGKKFEEQNKAGGTSNPNSKTTPVAVIEEGSINKLAATIAATVGNVLFGATSTVG